LCALSVVGNIARAHCGAGNLFAIFHAEEVRLGGFPSVIIKLSAFGESPTPSRPKLCSSDDSLPEALKQ
jgi:hypothetical protein